MNTNHLSHRSGRVTLTDWVQLARRGVRIIRQPRSAYGAQDQYCFMASWKDFEAWGATPIAAVRTLLMNVIKGIRCELEEKHG